MGVGVGVERALRKTSPPSTRSGGVGRTGHWSKEGDRGWGRMIPVPSTSTGLRPPSGLTGRRYRRDEHPFCGERAKLG